ncbi:MAG TPA: phosphoglycerate kinase [Candidatus Paceibacterota bacterium]|jgi:phosphoglycerate kinase|nr:phosphoglycerate kinase [Parcubacteria group bacterium]MDP6119359.1 phosphoglycerate kinase [Candidatus Paceibacterota bacterium]HJN62665.1 phosphoglycerate kinase [Candidatus Paceibacterota bacterium]|tara:strand:+ start:8657 stop:9802 length:1146 start_codon:yes stop_codon:yes gene_type:complete
MEEIIRGAKSIKEAESLKGKRVLLRLDLNVPVLNGKVEDDFRIRKSIPTINYLKERGAKVVIISHIWEDESKTLKPVYDHLVEKIPLTFAQDCINKETQDAIEKMQEGDVILLENLRLYEGETKNDINFANELSRLADIYVNDAFAVSHREHASLISLPKLLPSYYGLLFEDEIKNLSTVLNPSKPFLFILGGAKFETKIPLIIEYLEKADYVYVAGALANDFFKVQGYEMGISKLSGKDYKLEDYLDRKNLILPKDVTVKNKDGIFVKKPSEVESDDMILDIGVEAMIELKELVSKSKFILWNGPLGDYKKGFRDRTIDLAKAIIDSPAKSVVGGGDTFAVISKLKLEDEFDFMSTAGGALLEFIYSGTLPGLEALKNQA